MFMAKMNVKIFSGTIGVGGTATPQDSIEAPPLALVTLTTDGVGAHLRQVLAVLGQVFVQGLLADAPRVQRLHQSRQLLRLPDPPPPTHHPCRESERTDAAHVPGMC